LVTDSDGRAVPKQKVDFTIIKGEGTLSVENTTTDVNGQASTTLKLGNQLGLLEVEAKLSGTDTFVTFTTIVSINKPYSIEMVMCRVVDHVDRYH
ncbi:MAG TPA: hypothetical protein ENH82_08745, partial [bacterium]|nr:hypothetical protein [bacterium]